LPKAISGQSVGAETPGGRNTKQRTPKPSANASDAHDPDPYPAKHADADADGCKPDGQDASGNETHTPPAAATARTQAMERAANAPRPTP
jgi:hypothetical protein